MTLTKEQAELHAFITGFLSDPMHDDKSATSMIAKVFRVALALMTAEPVCYLNRFTGRTFTLEQQPGADKDMDVYVPLYTAPPAPVVPDEMPDSVYDILCQACGDKAWMYGDTLWNACRAAMLQGAEPSQHDGLPLDYLQGHKDGLEWAAQLAEANHPQTGDWLYDDPIELAKAIRKGPDMPEPAGNSPAIPDDVRRMDWLVSKTVDVREPMVYGSHSLFWSQTITDEEDDYHATKLREQIDAAMKAENAAAPQQEVK